MLNLTSPPTLTQTPPACMCVWNVWMCLDVFHRAGCSSSSFSLLPCQPKHSGLPSLHCLSCCRPLLHLLAYPPPKVPLLLQSSMPLWPARTTVQASLSLCISETQTHIFISNRCSWSGQRGEVRWERQPHLLIYFIALIHILTESGVKLWLFPLR